MQVFDIRPVTSFSILPFEPTPTQVGNELPKDCVSNMREDQQALTPVPQYWHTVKVGIGYPCLSPKLRR